MLTKTVEVPVQARPTDRYIIVAAQFNAQYVDALVAAADKQFRAAGATAPEVIRVPGSFEIPAVAAACVDRVPLPDAVICFGVILRGATTHAEHIALGVTHALADLQVRQKVPIIHGVLLFENEDQAKVRCMGEEHNRGREAAQVAIRMADIMRKLRAV